MKFYLGTHRPHWLAFAGVPLFVSRTTIGKYKKKPVAIAPWALDSGGFSEVVLRGGWTITPAEYIKEVRQCRDEVGMMDWAAPQDWMCEPVALAATGLTIAEHQRRTVANFLDLVSMAPELPFIPVLQGWAPSDYVDHVEQYARAGVDLGNTASTIGVGTVCRRQGTGEAMRVLSAIKSAIPKARLHGFGFKRAGIAQARHILTSADSLAWSYRARRDERMDGCEHKGKCVNCFRYAMAWRAETLSMHRAKSVQMEMMI